MFTVKIIEDSAVGIPRLTTFQLSYPRYIHSEFMTHRMFSRNASSSRAIPVKKMLEQVTERPATPVHWGKNQSGMQAREELEGDAKKHVQHLWMEAARNAAKTAELMDQWGAHKQVVNRILEPFQIINVIVTSSDYQNFFNLRSHPDADPTIKVLSDMMQEQYWANTPKQIGPNDFHLPYIQDEERAKYSIEELVKFSVARCARVSYLTHDKENPDPLKDIDLHDKLVAGNPMHASPAEHQARPALPGLNLNGNFDRAWTQYRKTLERHITGAFFAKV